ncbi:Endochitinase B [Seminavis robusta]|uniref:Endochitinase B n=1 Tax=Seminavis robusta TaxID=568900 RepID=A0A9N8E9P2_9STRA|nr:Endochitinase B [Seminavis robusta]|eukprot:Sro649_g181270.1 Endochitinase B (354) ;mRNA; r:42128-43421
MMMMFPYRRLQFPIACSLALLLLLNGQVALANDDFVVAGYLPEYRSYINVNNTAAVLTDLIVFSLQPDDQGNLGPCCLEPHHFAQAREARAYKQEQFPDAKPLKLWMSIGGAGRSASFPKIVADQALREKFVRNIKEKLLKEQFDGVDIDWETPLGSDDDQNFVHLARDLYKEIIHKSGLQVSVALHPYHVFENHNFYSHITRINLMTYDMVDGRGGHHAEMKGITASVMHLLKYKCPADKIVLGIPAYARHGRNPGQVKTYSEIVDAILKTNPDADLKSVAQRSEFKGYLYDGPNDVRRKVDMAVKDGHAGIFFWEIGQDKQHEEWAPSGILLEAAGEQVASSMASMESSEL